jgi:hypothetical protein
MMNTSFIRLALLLLCPLTLSGQDKKSFALVRQEDSIFVYERWIVFPGSQPEQQAREVKGEFRVKGSVYQALQLIKNEALIKRWQKHVSEFKVYPHSDTAVWSEYSYHDIPWPVSDQDHFLKYTMKEVEPGHLHIDFESVVDQKRAPVRSGVARMKLFGSWTLKKTKEGVSVDYRIISEPSNIPRIFTDPVIRRNLMSTIKEFIAILEEENQD